MTAHVNTQDDERCKMNLYSIRIRLSPDLDLVFMCRIFYASKLPIVLKNMHMMPMKSSCFEKRSLTTLFNNPNRKEIMCLYQSEVW
jgi:hypothetical protein